MNKVMDGKMLKTLGGDLIGSWGWVGGGGNEKQMKGT